MAQGEPAVVTIDWSDVATPATVAIKGVVPGYRSRRHLWSGGAFFLARLPVPGPHGKIDAVTPPHSPPPAPDNRHPFPHELGLGWPQPSLRTWPPDAHLALALLAALPVLIGLGWFAGGAMRVPMNLWAWASLVLVQPLLEELVFRGVLQGQALALLTSQGQPRRLGPVTLANALVTVAFVLLHLRAQPLAWALAVAVPSLVLGHLRERFASVWPAVGAHAFYNAGFGVTAWLVATA